MQRRFQDRAKRLYIRVEGFAGRLVPKKKSSNPNAQYYLDEPLMRKNLLELSPGVSKTYRPGFLFRGLNDSTIFYDENQERMANGIRFSFMMLAGHYLYEKGDKAMSIKTLNRMEHLVSPTVIRMDYRMQFYVAMIYFNAGDQTRFREIVREVEKVAVAKINESSTDVEENNRLYQLLTEIYERTEQYSKAAALLDQLLPSYPNDEGLKNQIDRYKALAEKQKNGQLTK